MSTIVATCEFAGPPSSPKFLSPENSHVTATRVSDSVSSKRYTIVVRDVLRSIERSAKFVSASSASEYMEKTFWTVLKIGIGRLMLNLVVLYHSGLTLRSMFGVFWPLSESI